MGRALLHLLASAAIGTWQLADAHGYIQRVIVNGVAYRGWNPDIVGSVTNYADRVGWTTNTFGPNNNNREGFIGPANYTSSNMACHFGAQSVKGHVPVTAGQNIQIAWNSWPFGHKGVSLSYLAPCGNAADGCSSATAAGLRFFKIDNSAPGLISGGGGTPPSNAGSSWVSDYSLGAHPGAIWTIKVPQNLAPGGYVLRHEFIGLHYAYSSINQTNPASYPDMFGAQNYPQCINLWVKQTATTGLLTLTPASGKAAASLYKSTDPGLSIDIYQTPNLSTYVIPGPTVIAGATPIPYQSQSLTTAWTEPATGTAISIVSTSSTRTIPVA